MLKAWVTLASGRLVRLACEAGVEWGLSLYASVIVKYRDEKTDRAVQLEKSVR